MSFLSDLHRSIFDARFYRDVIGRSWVCNVLFLAKLLVFTTLIAGFAKAYYFVHSERGVAVLVGSVFGDMELRGGRLSTAREPPYAVSGDALTVLMNRLAGYSRFFDQLPANFLVVDTRDQPDQYNTGAAAPAIVLKKTSAEFVNMGMEVPYVALFGKSDLTFTAASVQKYLNGKFGYVAAHFIIIGLFFGFFSITLSIFFLSAAAYIFSTDRSCGYERFLRIACYSVTPVTLGSAIVAISGVSADWTWHVFIVISTVLMFRSMANSSLDKAEEEKKGAQP